MSNESAREAPAFYGWAQLMAWFDDLSHDETHTAVSYDLEVSIDPAGGSIDVAGTVRLAPRQAPAGGGDATREACFLLSPGLDIMSPENASGDGHPALRRVTFAPGQIGQTGQTELRLAYRGRVPAAWITPASTELAFYNLWFPLFSRQLQPFDFRVLVRVPQDSVTAANGRLLPLPPHLRPAVHDHAAPRTYLWESVCPTKDIAVCSGPYLVHQGQFGLLTVEVFTQGDDFELGEPYLVWAGRVLPCLASWFGPLALSRLGLILTPESIQGGYSRPCHIVLPRPMAAKLLDPDEEQAIALWLAHEMGHLWFGSLVLFDSVNEPWLSEGFAEFARLVFAEAQWGETFYREQLTRYAKQVAEAADPSMHELARLRGGLMLAELRGKLGDGLMVELLTGFVGRFAGRTATGRDFAGYLENPPGREGLG